MIESRHNSIKSHQLPPTPTDLSFRPNQVRLSLGGKSQAGLQALPTDVHRRMFPTSVNASSSSLMIQSPKTSAAHCSDSELPTYSESDFQTVDRILELCFQKSQKKRSESRDSIQDTPATQNCHESSIVDKLTLIKSYEQTLRNQGMVPVEDSRIYRLLFRVVHECEQYLEKNKNFVKSLEMAKMERLSLMQNQLQRLRLKSQKSSLVSGARQYLTSGTLSQPEFEKQSHHQTDSLSYQIQNQMEEPIRSQPTIQLIDIDTISQIGATQSPFVGREWVSTSLTPATVQAKPRIGLQSRQESVEEQSNLESTKKITKLELKPTFHQTTYSQPNPVSDRQIDREIVEFHMQTGYYPSFDKDNIMRSQFTNDSIHYQQFTADKGLPQKQNNIDQCDIQIRKEATPWLAFKNLNNPPAFMPTRKIQTHSSDAFIMTTEGKEEDQMKPNFVAKCNTSSIYVNTNVFSDEYVTQEDNLSQNPSLPRIKPQSLSFCHDGSVNAHAKNNFDGAKPKKRDNSAHNRTALLPKSSGSRRHILPHKPPVDAKMTLAFKFKVQYSSIFRVFRAWNQHISLRKRQKKLKKLLLNGLVKAITKHEELLLKKTLKAFKIAKRLSTKTKMKIGNFQAMVARNIKTFYFKLMIKKFKEIAFARNLTALAQSHFKGNLRQKIVQVWRHVAKKRKEKLQKATNQIKRKPQASVVLMKFIGFLTMPLEQQTSFDILDLYSYCSIKKRFRPDSQRLARTIELTLKQQLRRIMSAWKEQKNIFQRFKRTLRSNMLRRVFQGLDRNCTLNYRLRLLKKRRTGRMQEQIIIAFLQNLEKVRRLALSKQLASNVHFGFQLRQFFGQWRNLFNFYKVGSLIKFSQKSTPLKILHLHKKRVFNRLKRYCKERNDVKQLIHQQRLKHLGQLIAGVFTSWAKIKTKMKALDERKAHICSGYEKKLRKVFFKGMMRACMIRQRQRAYREYVLMAKGLQALAQRVDYRRMQVQLKQICVQTFLQNLTKRAYLALKNHKQGKYNNQHMLVRARQFLAARSIHALFLGWREVIGAKKQRKLLAYEVKMFQNKKVIRKVYQTLFDLSVKRRELSNICDLVKKRNNLRTYRQVLLQMICKYANRINLRHLQSDFQQRKNRIVEKRFYLIWFLKYRNLKVREKHIYRTHQLLVKKQMFQNWFSLSKELYQHKVKVKKILFYSFAQTKQNVFEKWRKYTARRLESRKMKMVSSYFFIAKLLKKTIQALRMNAIHQKFTKAGANDNAPMLLYDCFKALRQHSVIQKRVKQFLQKSSLRKVKEVLHYWLGFSKQAKQSEEIVDFFQNRRSIRIQQQFFQALNFSSGVDVHKFHMSHLLRAWTLHTSKQKELKKKQEQVAFVHVQLTKHCALREWRNALFMSFTLSNIAIPYNKTILIKTAFKSLKKVTTQRRKAKIYYRRLMLFKALQALTIYQMNETKIKSIQEKLQAKKLGIIFDAFIDRCLVEQDLRFKAEELRARTNEIICERGFRHWFTICRERVRLEPIESAIKSEIRDKWLVKVTFAAMSRYFQIRRGKKQMYGNILHFYKQSVAEKSFRKLAVYAEHRVAQRAMKDDAQLFYMKLTFHRVQKVAQTLGQQKMAVAEDQYDRCLCIRTVAALRENATYMQKKLVAAKKADVFSAIRLKLNVFRALAIHTLSVEKARLAFASRKSLSLKMSSYATRQLGQLCRNLAPMSRKRPLKTKGIHKSRALQICVWSSFCGQKQVKHFQDLINCLKNGSYSHQKKASKDKNSLKHRRCSVQPSRPKRTRIKITKDSAQTPIVSKEQFLLVMDEMAFEKQIAFAGQQEEQEDVITQVKPRKEKGPVVKSSKPVTLDFETAPQGQHPIVQEFLDIQDLTRNEDSSLDVEIGIEQCYEETYYGGEQKHALTLSGVESQGIRDIRGQMEYIGTRLNKMHQEEFGQDDVIVQEQLESFSNVEDKWENFFKKQGSPSIGDVGQREEEQLHTMPSFREGNEECEKTLSVIYDDQDLARDTRYSFAAYQRNQVTQKRPRSPIKSYNPSPSDSLVMTAEQPKRRMNYFIKPDSPQYETNEPFYPPPRANQAPVCLQVSNKEIEDELQMYSTVQSYQQKKIVVTTPSGGGAGKDWLRKTLQSRLNESSQGCKRAGSCNASSVMDGSFTSARSLRSSSATHYVVQGPSKQNKVMQKIVENLTYLNLSRDQF